MEMHCMHYIQASTGAWQGMLGTTREVSLMWDVEGGQESDMQEIRVQNVPLSSAAVSVVAQWVQVLVLFSSQGPLFARHN